MVKRDDLRGGTGRGGSGRDLGTDGLITRGQEGNDFKNSRLLLTYGTISISYLTRVLTKGTSLLFFSLFDRRIFCGSSACKSSLPFAKVSGVALALIDTLLVLVLRLMGGTSIDGTGLSGKSTFSIPSSVDVFAVLLGLLLLLLSTTFGALFSKLLACLMWLAVIAVDVVVITAFVVVGIGVGVAELDGCGRVVAFSVGTTALTKCGAGVEEPVLIRASSLCDVGCGSGFTPGVPGCIDLVCQKRSTCTMDGS